MSGMILISFSKEIMHCCCYNSGVGDSACVSASNFLWDGVDNYVS